MFKSTLNYPLPFITHIPLQQIVYGVSTYTALQNSHVMKPKFL